MKKVISLKEIVMMLIALLIVMVCVQASAIDPSNLATGNNGATTITGNEYNEAQKDNTNNTANKTTNTNNSNNNTSLPQTGIEDYNVGILLIVCVASAIYAYRKISDYRNI